MIRYSRSEHSAYAKCPRAWYYQYGAPNGTDTGGYEPVEPYLPTTLGLAVHKGMETLFKQGSNLDAAVVAGQAEWAKLTAASLPSEGQGNPIYFAAEQNALIEGLIRGWRVSFWDEFNNQFEVIQIENEIKVALPDALFQARCDLVVRERSSGLLFIPDWKCVKDARNWDTKFGFEPQTWSQTFAVESNLNEQIGGCIYWAFIKGDRRNDQQACKLIYGYKQELRPGVFAYETERTKGYVKFAIWEAEELGASPSERIKFWVNWLPEEVRSSCYMQSPPVTRDQERISEWVSTSSSQMLEAHGKLESGAGPAPFPASRSDWNCRGCFAKEVCYSDGKPSPAWQARKDHHGEQVE